MGARSEWSRLVLSLNRVPEHRDAWQWLLDREHVYPTDQHVAPWKLGKRKDQPRAIAMVACGTGLVRKDNITHPLWVATYDVSGWSCSGTDETPEAAGLLASQWFTPKRSRTVYLVPEGGTHVLHGFLRWYVPHWIAAGFRVQPVVSRSILIVLRVTKGRHAWTFADWTVCTNSSAPVFGADHPFTGDGAQAIRRELARCHDLVTQLATWVREAFGVELRPTVGGTALAAAGRFLPPGEKLFRPHPLLLALCRDGGAYRGGYVYGQRYRGPGYKADVRRLYTAMIAQDLPACWSFGLGYDATSDLPGIFLCTISGEPRMPLYLAVWEGPDLGFRKTHWYGGQCIAVVPSTEYAGLRAMGVEVRPGCGFLASRPFTLSGFVDHLQALIRDAGPASPEGDYAKLMGNSVSGKWGTSPHMASLVWSAERPNPEADPAFTLDGDHLEGLWHVKSTRYLGSQQIGLATWVTARARSVLYCELARAMDAGRTVVHAHTDGYIATGPAPDWLPGDTDRIGDWRLVETDTDVITVRGGMYVIGQDIKTSGASGGTRRMVELQLDAGGYLIGGVRLRGARVVA